MILQTAGVGTTIGRAINVFKVNIKAAVYIMMIPLILSALEGVVAAIPAAITSITMPAMGMMVISALSAMLVFAMSMISVFLTLLFSAPLVRIYHSTLTRAEPMPLKQAIRESKKRLGTLLALTLFACVSMMAFGMIDAVLAMLGLLGISALLVATTAMFTAMGSSVLATPFVVALMFIGGAVMTLAGLAIISFQMMMSFLPLVCAGSGDYDQKWGFSESLGYAMRMLFANLPRAVVFGMLLIVFWCVLAAVLQLPIGIWMGIELRRLDDAVQPGTLPLHVSFVVNLLTSIIKTAMTPFGFCTLTLFWYDCQVRKEGADLALWLDKLHNPDAGNPASQAA